jgi:hypothetical protein
MINKFLLGSLIALLGWAGLAQAQAVLGNPITPDKSSPACPQTPTKHDGAGVIAVGGYSPAEVTAARIKVEEAQIQARRAAVKYLGTMDCQYYPEIEFGLVFALRTDRAESVRYEAALALGYGQGLTLSMLDALNMTALGLDLDGNPAETSERVRIAARVSLYQCACRGFCLPPEMSPVPFRNGAMPEPTAVAPAYYVAPALAPASPQERELAETIGTKSKATPPAPRPAYHFLLGLIGRDTPRDQHDNIDPRLRGLTLLGSETTVAIPTTPPIFASPRLPYNNE